MIPRAAGGTAADQDHGAARIARARRDLYQFVREQVDAGRARVLREFYPLVEEVGQDRSEGGDRGWPIHLQTDVFPGVQSRPVLHGRLKIGRQGSG